MADKKDNLTIYQKLFTVFGQGGGTMRSDTNLNPKYNLTDKDLIVSKSREEFEKTKLQLQQQSYLDSQWQKIENDMYQKATYYETTRLASYMDYEAMEFTPEIAVSLETMAEESCTLNEQGQIMSIYSDSSRIKKVLEDLFFNVLDIHSNLPMWTRNTCKYGDNFVHLKLNYKYGVIGATQLTNIEISRSDSNNFDYNETNSTTNDDSKKEVKFEWKSKNISFNAWEVAHFRLLGDDRKLPYGTSVLDKVRRTWRQLLLAEDAMLVYRVTRAPERRVFKVFVGNMDDKDVEAYIQKVANKFKRDIVVDSTNGNVDLRMNQMAVDQDYFIPVRDPAAASPIETLPGATNLSEIADIEYIQKKLLASLRIPKAYLGFEEVVGEGKNLALLDIRFARTINRIQKCIIQELNKIAIVHLYVLGFEEELNNFTLSLTNPSTQSDLLKIEQWKEKITLYRDAVTDPGNGLQAVSTTWAKKQILGMSDEEIKLDLQQQRFEKAMAGELEKTAEVIQKTGIFSNIDKLYGVPKTSEDSTEGGDTEGDDTGMDIGGDVGMDMGTDTGMDTGTEEPVDEPAAEPAAESYNVEKDLPFLMENKGYDLKGLKESISKSNESIDEINKEVESLLKD